MSGPDRKTPDDAHPDDGLLDRYLDGHSELSRAYRRTSAPPPPAELDRRILDLARAELASAATTRAAPRRGSRWRAPLAAAAVVVLSFGVLINLQREHALQPAVPAAPEVSVQRQQPAKAVERAPEQEASADAVAERPAVEARTAAAAPPPGATSVTAAPPPAPAAAPAPAPVEAPMLQQKAERDAEEQKKRRSEQESARKRFAADAPAAMMRPQAAAADGAGLAAPAETDWSCQAADSQWNRIRRLFTEQKPEQARDAYRELESACPDIEVPQDLRDRIEDGDKSDSPK